MCFSATASFTLSGALVPIGLYTIARVSRSNTAWLPFAAFPLIFGLQQSVEGFVWLGLRTEDSALVGIASRTYLFFSHFFWLLWVPFSVWMLEQDPARKRIVAVLTGVGCVYGLSLFLPAITMPGGLVVKLVHRSLEYETRFFYDVAINRTTLKLFYAAIIVSALFLSTDRRIQLFGALVAASLLITYAFFAYALISVWCFFAAILSVYLAAVLFLKDRHAPQIPGSAELSKRGRRLP